MFENKTIEFISRRVEQKIELLDMKIEKKCGWQGRAYEEKIVGKQFSLCMS